MQRCHAISRERSASRWMVGTGRLAAAIAVAAIAAGCGSQRFADPLVERCGEVVRYRNSHWTDVKIVDARYPERERAVTLHVEGVSEPGKERVSDFIECVFRPGERAALERVVMGGRTLDAKELALVNAELLLRDLGGDGASG